MAKFVIESEHDDEECLKALDEMLAKGKETLNKFVFGCKNGDHVGFAYVDADSQKDALEILPEFLRDKACVHEVEKITPDMIKEYHQK